MISTETMGMCGVLKIQFETFGARVPAVRRFETILTCGLDIAVGNITTIAHTRGKFKNFTVLCRTGTNTVQVATCTPRCLIAGIILFGILMPFVYTVRTYAPCAPDFFINSRQHVSNPPVLKKFCNSYYTTFT